MWSDNETTQDLLGYQVHADLLRKIILNDAMLPISIGVFGNWGSGKSSLMLLLQQSLQEWEKSQANEYHKIILQVYFNSWQFESYDSTKLTMIESILEALDKDINTRKDVFERADDLLARIFPLPRLWLLQCWHSMTAGLSRPQYPESWKLPS